MKLCCNLISIMPTLIQRKIEVGIMSAPEISFEILQKGGGVETAAFCDGRILYRGRLHDELCFDAAPATDLFSGPSFILFGVTIGVGFHWERKQDQTFAGALKLIVEGDRITAVNVIGVEDYLLSVISSEMKATASLELLKAHAVISRSWVITQIENRKAGRRNTSTTGGLQESGMLLRWWDHDDHEHFDVCADDHCQRYQGLSVALGDNVRRAVSETWGQVLRHGGEICDARFSKCCGGMTERFSTCWEDRDYPYLQVVPDTPAEGGDPFCKTSDQRILSQVLNDFDLETEDFFDWQVRYGREELSKLVCERSGVDFGEILDLVPEERGGSGRISRLRIVGTRRTLTIGKELLIRKWLSTSHLKSSDFEPVRSGEEFILKGRGWGHGVGLCQIGAAVMSDRGYGYAQILQHYYPGSKLERR